MLLIKVLYKCSICHMLIANGSDYPWAQLLHIHAWFSFFLFFFPFVMSEILRKYIFKESTHDPLNSLGSLSKTTLGVQDINVSPFW